MTMIKEWSMTSLSCFEFVAPAESLLVLTAPLLVKTEMALSYTQLNISLSNSLTSR